MKLTTSTVWPGASAGHRPCVETQQAASSDRTNLKFSRWLTALIAVGVLTGCSSLPSVPQSPLANYEVLPQPTGLDYYCPGKEWLIKLGPNGPSLTQTNFSGGPQELNTQAGRHFKSKLVLPLTKWISDSLGITADKDLSVELKNVSHCYVSDVYALATTHAVLWEVLLADSFTLALTNTVSGDTTAKATPQALAKLLTSSLSNTTASVEVSNLYTGHYFVQCTNSALVIAIRVVQPKYTPREKRSRLDLSDHAVGKVQPVGYGYKVVLAEPADSIRQTAMLSVINNSVPQFAGTNVSFTTASPWRNPYRTSTRSSDPNTFEWETLSILWTADAKNCEFWDRIQYLTLKNRKSGLYTIHW